MTQKGCFANDDDDDDDERYKVAHWRNRKAVQSKGRMPNIDP
jgi:hypothetical protein